MVCGQRFNGACRLVRRSVGAQITREMLARRGLACRSIAAGRESCSCENRKSIWREWRESIGVGAIAVGGGSLVAGSARRA